MSGFTKEIKAQLVMYNKLKRRTVSLQEMMCNSKIGRNNHSNVLSNCDSSPKSMSTKKTDNRNNSKTTDGDIAVNTSKSFSRKLSKEDKKDAFALYLKMIKQLRFNRRNHLRSVSCQSDLKSNLLQNDSINQTLHDSRSRSHMCVKKDSGTTIKPRRSSSTSTTGTTNGGSGNIRVRHSNSTSYQDTKLYSNYQKLHYLLTSKNCDSSKLKQLEEIVKNLVTQIQTKYGIKDINKADKKTPSKLDVTNLKTKCFAKAIQVKADTKSKAVNINPMELLNYYITTLTEFISKSATNDIYTLSHLKVTNAYMQHLSHKIKVKIAKELGDCDIGNDPGILPADSDKELDVSQKDLMADDKCVNNMIEPDSHVEGAVHNISYNSEQRSSKSKRLNPGTVNLPFTNVPKHHPNIFCDSSTLVQNNMCLYRDIPHLVKQLPVKDFPLKLRTKENSAVSELSNNTSLLDSVSLIDALENNSFYFNIYTKIILLPQQVLRTIKTIQPFVRKDSCSLNFVQKSLSKLPCPKISVQPYISEGDKTSVPTFVTDMDKSDNSNFSLKADEKVCINTEGSMFDSYDTYKTEEINAILNSNQSQNDFNYSDELCVNYLNFNQSQCCVSRSFHLKSYIENHISISDSFKELICGKNYKSFDDNPTSTKESLTNESDDEMTNPNPQPLIENTKTHSMDNLNASKSSSISEDFRFSSEITVDEIIMHYKPKELATCLECIPSQGFSSKILNETLNSATFRCHRQDLDNLLNAEERDEKQDSALGVQLQYSSIMKNAARKKYYDDCKWSCRRGPGLFSFDIDPFPTRCVWKSLFKSFLQPWIDH